MEQLLTVDEVAAICQISRAAVYALIADGQLTKVQLGGLRKTRVRLSELERFLDIEGRS